jgi:predicted transposase/invertase (TIGR01784 family)
MPENTNDKGYRRLLADKRNFLDLVKGRIAAPWVEQIDESRLELIDRSFVTKDFRDKETDIIYKAEIGGTDVIFYILLELQSKVDFTMPFRLLVYMVELLRRLFASTDKKVRETKDFRLPVIVPIVLYNGASEWSCVKSFREYLAGYGLFVPNVLDFEYILIDVNRTDETELLKIPTLVNLVMLADRKDKPDNMMRRLGKVFEISGRLTEEEQLQLKEWIFDVLLRKAKGMLNKKNETNLRKIFENKEGTDMTYALETAFDEIIKRSERKGERKGKLEGERKALLKAAKVMIVDGLPLEKVSQYSGMSVDELKKHIKPAE